MVLLPVEGLEMAGDKALRKSRYAVGGVMGVLRSSSCLMKSAQPGRGLRGSSEGRTGPAEQGVLRVGRTGLTEGDLTVGDLIVGVSTMGDAEGMAASLNKGDLPY